MSSSPKIQSLYTDGACIGNPGPGGWGVAIYFQDGSIHELGASEPATTNNRMEMQAAIAALEFLAATQLQESVTLYTDSEYLINGITKWIKGWKRKGWKTSQGQAVLNQDLWETLDRLNHRGINWQHVRGHNGNVGNERCDAIARAFASSKRPSLQHSSTLEKFGSLPTTDTLGKTIESSNLSANSHILDLAMSDSNIAVTNDGLESLPSEVRVANLTHLIEALRIADEIATKGYLIASSELADLMDVNASAVTAKGDNWVWRNWIVSRVRREGNQILWQLERVEE
ncbi:MAG: ribonuclease HI [Cyanosarcina radialis HA8281-LM2]|jgi:ribonuclease HI|nr:ribonuclease HI [Cyanosarcina radialis HA8281-LM2]